MDKEKSSFMVVWRMSEMLCPHCYEFVKADLLECPNCHEFLHWDVFE